jgi:hypothetical protein
VPDCRYNHHALLHGAIAARPEKKKEEVVTSMTDVSALTSQAGEQSLHLVKLYVRACDGNKKTICHVTALLDSGSSTTILREEIARQLGVRLNFEDVAITRLHGTNTKKMASLKLQVSPNSTQCQPSKAVDEVLLRQHSAAVVGLRRTLSSRASTWATTSRTTSTCWSAGTSNCSSYCCTANKMSG